MSDEIICTYCSEALPLGAVFCPSCGTWLGRSMTAAEPTAAPPPQAWTQDATRVEAPESIDTTQVFSPAPAQPLATPFGQDPSAPWQPAETRLTPTAWTPPAPPPGAPSWQAPSPAPGAPQGWEIAPAAPWASPSVPAPGTEAKGGSVLGGTAALLGGVLTLVSLFTAWISSNATHQTVTGWDLTSGDAVLALVSGRSIRFESTDPYLLLGLGLGALALGVLLFTGTARSIVQVVAALVGLAIIGLLVRDWLSIVDVVQDIPGAGVTQQFGYYLGLAGGVLTVIAAMLPGKKRS